MRTKNSIKNATISFITQVIKITLNFIMRIYFVKILVNDYLGVEGLFSNILLVLSLAELGVGQAMAYALYGTLKNKNTKKLKSLMNYYKKAYLSIGAIILILGISITPFLDFLIKDKPNINENFYVIYILYVISIASSYFSSYKRELINADQKMYISNIYIMICLVIMNILQIAGLLLTKQYLIFLIIKIIMIWVENIAISVKANKLYPFLKEHNVEKIDKKDLKPIKKNIYGTILYKIGRVGVNSTDIIILSKYIGLGIVGVYSNYRLIVVSISGILNQVISSITSSVGNLGKDDPQKSYQVYKKIYFITFWIYSLCSLGIYFLINDFVNLWLGNDYLLENKVIIILSINFFITGLTSIITVYRDAYGMYWRGKLKPLLELLINLVISLALVRKHGLYGVLLGTLISNVCINIWYEAKILYKEAFREKFTNYFTNLFKLIIPMIISIIFIQFVLSIISIQNSPLILIIKFITIVIITNLIYILFYRKKEEFKYCLILINKIIKNKEENK